MEDVVKKKKKKFPPEIVKGKTIAPIAVKGKKNFIWWHWWTWKMAALKYNYRNVLIFNTITIR